MTPKRPGRRSNAVARILTPKLPIDKYVDGFDPAKLTQLEQDRLEAEYKRGYNQGREDVIEELQAKFGCRKE